jgi:hypothetical protein
MRRVISIFLVFIYLFSIPRIGEFFKIYNLIEHFIEHKNQNSDLSIFSLFKLHYFNNNTIDDDYQKDMKLPFKSTLKFEDSSPVIYPTFNQDILLIKFNIQKTIIPNYHSNANFFSFLSKIWHPPKYIY